MLLELDGIGVRAAAISAVYRKGAVGTQEFNLTFLCCIARFRYLDLEIANLDIAPCALRKQISDRAERRQLAEIRIPPFLESKLRRVRISRERAALRLADLHDDVRVGGRVRLRQIAQIPLHLR